MPRYLDPVEAKAKMIGKSVWPISVWPGSGKRWLSVCMDCGSFVTPTYRNVMQPGRGGCNPCARRKAAQTRRTPHEEAVKVMRGAGVEPLEMFPGVDVPWRCRCLSALCPGLWMGDPADIRPRLSDARASRISACKYCARSAVRPERAAQRMIENGVEPLEDYASAWSSWPCVCLRCGADDITPTYANVVLGGQGGCKHCGGRLRVPDQQAVSEMRAAGADPLEAYPGVNERWRCRCLAADCPGPAGRIIYPRLGWVRRGAQACKWCAGVVIDPLAARDVMISQAGLVPQEPYPGVRERWKCRCMNCQSIVHPTLGSVNSRGTGCSECAEYGFQRGNPGLLYLVTHQRLNAAKIGICNLNTRRIERHEGRGWKRHATLAFPLGGTAELLEKQVLAEWRAQGWRPVLDSGKPYDGWTETVPLDEEITPQTLWQGILDLHELVAAGGPREALLPDDGAE
ncbi:hypothetical protein AB0E06_35100 [Streptomyces sp. NPDC048109]|uniref:hypothetical protein n=1 Tax=Streptomyces sp. NPDC048109 TaxID=3155482 RepID=UPI00341EC323